MSFLIGGGCYHIETYVELIVDGVGVLRQTGSCKETMRLVEWDLSLFIGRSAQIKIVDDSETSHINVDAFTFDWLEEGGSLSQPSGPDDLERQCQHSTHQVETVHSGSAYVYRRMDSDDSDQMCTGDLFACEWYEVAKLMASNKREKALFGYSVKIDDSSGLVAIGAPDAQIMGLYREVPTYYPYEKGFLKSFPLPEEDMRDFLEEGSLASTFNGAKGVWKAIDEDEGLVLSNDKTLKEGGSIYLFKRTDETRDGFGNLLSHVIFPVTETLQLQPSDMNARDHFGFDLSLDQYTLIGSSLGQDSMGLDAGAVYVFDSHVIEVEFTEEEFVASEGTDTSLPITIKRVDSSYPLTIFYSTSDLTAIGIDSTRFDDCLSLGLRSRTEGCGDYEQSSGEVTFDVGIKTTTFYIRIMNDPCYEHYSEFIQLHLSIPGSYAPFSHQLSARIRIDDDDFTETTC